MDKSRGRREALGRAEQPSADRTRFELACRDRRIKTTFLFLLPLLITVLLDIIHNNILGQVIAFVALSRFCFN